MSYGDTSYLSICDAGKAMDTKKYGDGNSNHSHSFARCIFPKVTSSSSRAGSVHFPWVLILHAKVPGKGQKKSFFLSMTLLLLFMSTELW